MTVGSLFSGVGLLDLGLEQAGMQTVWQVEYDDWCRERLKENFPHTEKYKDVREVGKHNLKPVDLICGGFPCQDISVANTSKQGLDGEKSGLWFEMFRIICELRPGYALIENVPNLINRGLHRVLADLASIGFDAQWQTLRASTFGLPHKRNRLFIIAYTGSVRPSQPDVENIFAKLGKSNPKRLDDKTTCDFEEIGRKYPQIPEHLRMDNGRSFEFSEIERAVKAYGNGVAVPVAKFIGERILEFDKNI
jgi:DNA (cytosine-5)-methyltransferase 1